MYQIYIISISTRYILNTFFKHILIRSHIVFYFRKIKFLFFYCTYITKLILLNKLLHADYKITARKKYQKVFVCINYIDAFKKTLHNYFYRVKNVGEEPL